jgi:hypothetical protein
MGNILQQYLPNFFTPLDWVASAQHFGLPTRLLDWTFNPFIALYFSLFKDTLEQNESYRLLVINKEMHIYSSDIPTFQGDITQDYNTENTLLKNYMNFVNAIDGHNFQLDNIYNYHSKIDRFVNLIKEAKSKEFSGAKPFLFFCSIYDSNPRIIAQNGLFQIPRNIEKKNGIYQQQQLIENACEKIYVIKEDQREKLLSILHKLNISLPKLFPDLQNICTFIKKQRPN